MGESPHLPALLALVASFMFGVSNVTAKRGLAFANPQAGATLSIGVCALVFLIGSPLWWQGAHWLGVGVWVFVLNGIFHPMLSMAMAYEANQRAGATIAATLSATSPLFASAIAVALLGERITLAIGLGSLLTVAGVMRLSWSRGAGSRVLHAALLFATGAAVIRALNQNLTKWGLELLPNALMAGFISFAVAFVGSSLIYRGRYGSWPLRMPARGYLYFGLAGTCIAAAIGCMFTALGRGDVVVVSPLVASYPLFTLMTALALGDEKLTVRVLAGVLLVVGGVVLISLGAG